MPAEFLEDPGRALLVGVAGGFAFSALVGTITSLVLLFAQGRVRRADRIRDHYLAAVADTRDRLLDLFESVERFAAEDVGSVRRLAEATRGLRYGRYRLDYLADAEVIQLMTTHLPTFMEKWPAVAQETTRALSRLPNLTRIAMFDQELEVLRNGRPVVQTAAQRSAIDHMEAAMTESLRRFKGWGRLRLAAQVWARQWWPH